MFNGRVNKVWLGFLVVFVLIFALYYFPLPYYISAPGDAIELQPIIEVEEGYEEQGSFMLTTVKMGGANFISFARAQMDNYMELIDKETILAHYDDEEDYTEYQLQVMETSQDAAIMVAYQLADKPVEVVNEGSNGHQFPDGQSGSANYIEALGGTGETHPPGPPGKRDCPGE
jgi:Lon-like protease